MKITTNLLKAIKACSSSVQKFNNTFAEVIIPEGTTFIEVFDRDLFKDAVWLVRNLKTGIKTIKFYGNIYQYEYDSNNNLIKTIDHCTYITQYEYDSNNNLIKTIDPNGEIYQDCIGKYGNSRIIFK